MKINFLDVDSLLALDIVVHRTKVNIFLKDTSEMVRTKASSIKNSSSKNKNFNSRKKDYFGKDLRKTNLIGADFRGACLIASDLRNVDLRDADLSGANLINSIFLTQGQINTAKGDSNTKLPMMLLRPSHWSK